MVKKLFSTHPKFKRNHFNQLLGYKLCKCNLNLTLFCVFTWVWWAPLTPVLILDRAAVFSKQNKFSYALKYAYKDWFELLRPFFADSTNFLLLIGIGPLRARWLPSSRPGFFGQLWAAFSALRFASRDPSTFVVWLAADLLAQQPLIVPRVQPFLFLGRWWTPKAKDEVCWLHRSTWNKMAD